MINSQRFTSSRLSQDKLDYDAVTVLKSQWLYILKAYVLLTLLAHFRSAKRFYYRRHSVNQADATATISNTVCQCSRGKKCSGSVALAVKCPGL